MSARIEMLPAHERVWILSRRLTALKNGCGDFRPSNRSRAINECSRCLDEAKADLGRLN